jgi:hypothetical protein
MGNKLLIGILLLTGCCMAQMPANRFQNNLSKRVTIDVKHQPVGDVLQQISKAGDFYFAYNGALFAQDSIVNLNVKGLPLRNVIDQLFDGKVDYKESDKYVILRYAVNHLTIEAESITTAENLYLINGYVVDTQTGKKIKHASVYEKKLLQSTLTDNDGYFSLKFKGDHEAIILTASKETYRDSSLVFLSSIHIKPEGYDDPDKEKGTFFSNAFSNLGIGKLLLSSKQKIQSLNIPSFFANTPFQASLTPGLSSHGMMSAHVINKVSLNALGGYTAGVTGVEVAGLFNLTKGDVKMIQVAGLFNSVGHSVAGVQIAGLANTVQDKVSGVQVAGLINKTKSKVTGLQVAGLTNIGAKDFRGMQIAGLTNINANSNGTKLAGLGNVCNGVVRGMQLAALFNYAKNLKGFQLGLVNIADTSSGASLGLINWNKNGYHKVSLSTNDLVHANIAFKTGNSMLYTILFVGKSFSDTAKIETFGMGLGHDFLFGRHISFATELSAQQLHLGNWEYSRILTKAQLNLQITLFKGFSIFGGPTFNYYLSKAPLGSSTTGYKQQIVPDRHFNIRGSPGWLGFNAGITIM